MSNKGGIRSGEYFCSFAPKRQSLSAAGEHDSTIWPKLVCVCLCIIYSCICVGGDVVWMQRSIERSAKFPITIRMRKSASIFMLTEEGLKEQSHQSITVTAF